MGIMGKTKNLTRRVKRNNDIPLDKYILWTDRTEKKDRKSR